MTIKFLWRKSNLHTIYVIFVVPFLYHGNSKKGKKEQQEKSQIQDLQG
jgi:hypothetical protein